MSFSTSFRNSVGEVDSLQVLRALWRGLAVPDEVLQEAMPELEGRLRYAFSPVVSGYDCSGVLIHHANNDKLS